MSCNDRKIKLQELYLYEVQENNQDHEQVFNEIKRLQNGILESLTAKINQLDLSIPQETFSGPEYLKSEILKELLKVKIKQSTTFYI